MRHDMYKVIVERPRRGGGYASDIQDPQDLEESPRQEGLRRRHRSRKSLNENLRPLERFLAAHVNRPWDKVYAEICAGIDRRNTVQQHVFQHIGDFVAVNVKQIDGVLYHDRRFGRLEPLGEVWGPKFYVDPRTRMLRPNTARISARREWKQKHLDTLRARSGGPREDRRIVDATTQLHRIDGVWYRIALEPVVGAGQADRMAVDVLRKLPADQCPSWQDSRTVRSNHTLFGKADVYARSKRQLGSHELRHHGLVNRDP